MFELYEVLWQRGEDEFKKYVLARDEEDLQQFLVGLDARYFRLATQDNIDVAYLGPTVLTRNEMGVWTES